MNKKISVWKIITGLPGAIARRVTGKKRFDVRANLKLAVAAVEEVRDKILVKHGCKDEQLFDEIRTLSGLVKSGHADQETVDLLLVVVKKMDAEADKINAPTLNCKG